MSDGIDSHGTKHFDPKALSDLIDWWNAAECGCCSPTALDYGLDQDPMWDPEFLARMRRFGIDVANTAEGGLDRLAEDAAERARLEGRPIAREAMERPS